MRLSRNLLSGALGLLLAAQAAGAQAPSPLTPRLVPSVPLVLAGGTVVDVTGWGGSAKDLPDAIVIVRDGRITDVGSRMAVSIPKGARVIDCSGKFLIPGLIDGFAGMNSQGQANAYLYMGVTTVVAVSDARRGAVDLNASPTPHLYLMDSAGSTDNWSLLAKRPEWALKLRQLDHPRELSPDDTLRQLNDTARLGTRAVWLGHNLTAANVQWIIARAHQMGLATYGEFVATPYNVGVEAGVDALPHMGRYELGVIPDELERPLVEDSDGTAATTAYDYAERLPPTDLHLRAYARFLAAHHAALMPTFSIDFARLPSHRNLWKEPAAALLDPARVFEPTNRATGEIDYSLAPWTRHLPAMGQRYRIATWKRASARRASSRPCACGASTRPSSPPSRISGRLRSARPGRLARHLHAHRAWSCWFAWGFHRARPWPPPPTTTASSSAGTSWARSPPDAAPTSSSLTATPPRTSGTPAASPASSWTAI
jgi:hypothetical protein